MEVMHDVLLGTLPLIATFGTSAIAAAVACFVCKRHDRKIARQRAQAKEKAARIRAAKKAKQAELRKQAEHHDYFVSLLSEWGKETAPSAGTLEAAE